MRWRTRMRTTAMIDSDDDNGDDENDTNGGHDAQYSILEAHIVNPQAQALATKSTEAN